MAGQYHRFNGRELGQTPGDKEGQGGLVGCSPQDCKESDTTQQLNNRASLNHAIPRPQAALPNPLFLPLYILMFLHSTYHLLTYYVVHVYVTVCLAVSLHQNRSATQGFLSDFYSLKYISSVPYSLWASLIAQSVKNLPAMQETRVQFLSWEDLLEKEMAIHCSILFWRISWTEDPGGLQPMGLQESDTTE